MEHWGDHWKMRPAAGGMLAAIYIQSSEVSGSSAGQLCEVLFSGWNGRQLTEREQLESLVASCS